MECRAERGTAVPTREPSLDGLGIASWQWDLGANEFHYSDEWKRIRGLHSVTDTAEEGLSRVHPDDVENLERYRYELIRGERESYECDHRVRHNDGSWIWIAERCRAIRKFGKVVRVVGCDVEITKRKQEELERKEHRQHYTALPDAVPAAIIRLNASGEVVYASEYLRELTGCPVESFLAKGWHQSIHPDDLPKILEHISELAQGPPNQEVVLDGKRIRITKPDGSSTWTHPKLRIHYGADGNLTAVTTVLIDIDEHIKIEQKQALLSAIVEATSDFIGVSNPQREILYHNKRAAELLPELSQPEDRPDFMDAHPSWAQQVIQEEAIPAAIQHGSWTGETALRRSDGTEIPVSQVFIAHKGLDGSVEAYSTIIRDISGRKAAESALQESETKFRRVAENVPGMVARYIVHPDGTEEFAFVSSGVRDVFGFEPKEVTGPGGMSKIWGRIHEDDRDRVKKELAASVEKLEPFTVECRLNLPDKGIRWTQSHLQPTKAPNGDLVWDGVLLDHTENRVMQRALEDSRVQFQRIAENIPGMIYRYILRADGKQVMPYVGSRCRELYEVDPEAAMRNAELLYERVHPDDIADIRELSRIAIETLQPSKVDYRVVLPKKGTRWLRAISQPSRNDNGEFVSDGVIFDITDRKQAEIDLQRANEELAKATKMKDEFLATMSHELRTPLSAILGMNEGLQQGIFGPVTEEQQNSYDVIQQSGRHLLDLINEVLDLAKIESGSMELEFSDVDIKQLCASSLRLVKQQAEKKNIDLSLRMPSDLPKLAADEKRIRQVLVNLLSNALKFTPIAGKVSVDVRRQVNRDSVERLRISIADTGIGIAPGNLNSLFDPFVQADSSLSRAYEGTGLGLSLVKRFVDLHGGNVAVNSQLGIGSCFTVDLPYRKALDTNPSSRVSPQGEEGNNIHSSPASHPPTNAKILLAEDNELSALAVTKYLERLGCQVVLASNGQAALEAVRESVPDIVLMDVQMPGMDGLEATRKIRAMPSLGELPIIALTGLAMPEDASKCLHAGANRYLSKPYTLHALAKAIRELIPSDSSS